jgi:hypothetical protein
MDAPEKLYYHVHTSRVCLRVVVSGDLLYYHVHTSRVWLRVVVSGDLIYYHVHTSRVWLRVVVSDTCCLVFFFCFSSLNMID